MQHISMNVCVLNIYMLQAQILKAQLSHTLHPSFSKALLSQQPEQPHGRNLKSLKCANGRSLNLASRVLHKPLKM